MRTILVAVALLLGTLHAQAQAVTLDYPRAMLAGDAWLLTINGLECAEADVALLNGLTLHQTTVTPDRNGRAAWGLPEGTLNQAGDMLLTVTCDAASIERVIRVLPGTVAGVEAFTVANAILAYGEARTDLIALLSDRYGNPASPTTDLNMLVRYPDGTQAGLAYRQSLGIAVAALSSQGTPGRVRIAVTAGDVLANAEFTQTAGVPAEVRLSAPPCVLVDGRDLIPVTVGAVDRYGYPANDGQTLRLMWAQGGAVAVLRDGRGLVRIPPPPTVGTLTVTVSGFDTRRDIAIQEECGG